MAGVAAVADPLEGGTTQASWRADAEGDREIHGGHLRFRAAERHGRLCSLPPLPRTVGKRCLCLRSA